MNSRESYERALCLFVYLGYEYLYLISNDECLAGDLLGLKKSCVSVTRVKQNVAVIGKYLAYRSGDYLLTLALVSILHSLTLTLADTLNDNRLCSACAESADVLCLYLGLYHLAQSVSAAESLCLLKRDLTLRIGYLLNDLLLNENSYVLFNGVDSYSNESTVSVFLSASRNESRLDLLKHILLGYSLFLFQKIKCNKKFLVHFSFHP